jgi:hypothetical protein
MEEQLWIGITFPLPPLVLKYWAPHAFSTFIIKTLCLSFLHLCNITKNILVCKLHVYCYLIFSITPQPLRGKYADKKCCIPNFTPTLEIWTPQIFVVIVFSGNFKNISFLVLDDTCKSKIKMFQCVADSRTT